MSSINPGSSGNGNSVNPGANTVSTWATFPAVSNVDFDNKEILNAQIDLSGDDSLTNVNITDGTLKGTTTLFTGHTFSGDIETTGDIITTTLLSDTGLHDLSMTAFTKNFIVRDDTSVPTTLTIQSGDVTGNGGNPELVLQRGTTGDGNNDWIFSTTGGAEGRSKLKLSTLQSDSQFSGNIVDFNIPNDGLANGVYLEVYGGADISGELTAHSVDIAGNLTATAIDCDTIESTSGSTMVINGGGADMVIGTSVGSVSVNNLECQANTTTAGSSKFTSDSTNVAYIGSNPRTTGNINAINFIAPNGTSQCHAFCGQKDALTPNSVGLASRNQSTGDVVGFAPSAISGIEKWSFTGKHQCSFTGKITNEHRGMVVESVGRVCGIADKGKLKYSYDKDDPEDYSNASPVVRLCSTKASKKVVGVVRDVKDEPDTIDGDLVYCVKGDGSEPGDKRIMVNAIGEGLVWVADTNGKVYNGDLIQSSNITGYSERQPDDLIRSSTIAKITADCDFVQEQVPVKEILKDEEGNNILDSQGRLIWANSGEKKDKFEMRYLEGGRKAVLLPCIYYCG